MKLGKPLILATVLALLISGCASLRVDVDVYKGPLSNDEEVQIEQMAAMAIGAKPLLLTLRDLLEAKERHVKINELTSDPRYRPDYIHEVIPAVDVNDKTESDLWCKNKFFNSELARKVNGILNLYMDQDDSSLSPEFVTLYAEINKRAAEYFKQTDELMSVQDKASKEKLESLKEAARMALQKLFFAVLDALIQINNPEVLNRIDAEQRTKLTGMGVDFITDAIRLGSIEEIHSARSNPNDALKSELKRRIPGYASEGSTYIVDFDFLKHAREELLADSKSNAELIKMEFQRKIEENEVHIEISRDILHDALMQAMQTTRLYGFLTDLRTACNDYLDDSDLHKEAKGGSWSVVMKPPNPWDSSKGHGEFIDVATAQKQMRALLSVVEGASGLERGRLPRGLETIIETYLQAADNVQARDAFEVLPGKSSVLRATEQERLEDALSGFGEKVVDLGNSEILVSGLGGEAKRYSRVLQSVGNSITITANELTTRRKHRDGLVREGSGMKLALKHGLDASSEDVYKDIIAEFGGEAARAKGETDKAEEELTAAKKKLDELADAEGKLKTQLGIPQFEFDAARKALENGKGVCEKTDADSVKQCTALKDALTKAEKALSEKQDELKLAGQARKDAEVARDKLAEASSGKKKQSDGLKAASDAVKGAKVDVHGIDASDVHSRIEKALNALLSDGDTKNDEAAKAALAELAGINPPVTADLPSAPGSDDSKEVFDQLIAALEAEHVNTVRELGQDSEASKSLEASIKLAYDYRANKVFIRPPSFYLRSSYPVTGLQADPELGWKNRLLRQAMKSVPIIGECLTNGVFNQDIKIQSEIDKQFWQTINSVKVNGAGNENYVLTQDDIGNWYTKGYSSNPEEIIKAAQSSALFALGGSMNVNLRDKLKNPKDPKLFNSDIAAGTHSTSFDNRTNDYIAQTAADKDTVVAEMEKSGGLRSNIESRWGTLLKNEKLADTSLSFFRKDLNEQMDGAYDVILKPVLEQLKQGSAREEAGDALFKAVSKSADPLVKAAARVAIVANKKANTDPQTGLRIANALNAIVRFQSDLKARVSALTPAKKVASDLAKEEQAVIDAAVAAADALQKNVLADLDGTLQGEILGLIQHRRLVVDTFVAQLEQLGGDLGSKPAS